jgi:two-component system NarL family sensor kinase
VAAYRIVVEAMTNAVRHAAATRCEVRLAVASPLTLGIEVADNGRGMGDDPRAGIGLESMRERAAELGGAWRIESTEGGVRVIASLPLSTTAPLVAAA